MRSIRLPLQLTGSGGLATTTTTTDLCEPGLLARRVLHILPGPPVPVQETFCKVI